MTSRSERAREEPGYLAAWRACKDPRMPRILLIGFISGFPWVLIGSCLTLWLQEHGLSRSSIGLFGLVFTLYAVNALWAPLVDRVQLPWLGRLLGARKAWVVLMQTVILAAVLAMGTFNLNEQLWAVAVTAVVIAAASATQDVAIDALRIELIQEDEQRHLAAGAAMAASGWWAGYGLGGAFALYLADYFQARGLADSWQLVYRSLGAVVVLCSALLIFWVTEQDSSRRRQAQQKDFTAARRIMPAGARLFGDAAAWLGATYVMPVANFMRRHGLRIGLALLLFVILFKVGEAFLGRMSLVFYREVGFDKTQIAHYSKLAGSFTICFFSILCGYINANFGIFRGLLIGGIAMAATNLMFTVLALTGPLAWWFALTVVADQFTTAFATVAFVAFLSQLCDRRYTATQYAALASLGNLSRTTLAAASGFVVDGLDGNWAVFFILTTVMVAPGLLMLVALRRRLAPLA